MKRQILHNELHQAVRSPSSKRTGRRSPGRVVGNCIAFLILSLPGTLWAASISMQNVLIAPNASAFGPAAPQDHGSFSVNSTLAGGNITAPGMSFAPALTTYLARNIVLGTFKADNGNNKHFVPHCSAVQTALTCPSAPGSTITFSLAAPSSVQDQSDPSGLTYILSTDITLDLTNVTRSGSYSGGSISVTIDNL